MKQKSILFIISLLLLTSNSIYSLPSDCEVIKIATWIELKNSKLTEIDTIVFQINNRSGERYSEISIPYSKIVKVSDIDGWIEDVNGKIVRKIRNSDITERNEVSESALYEDCFVKSFSLKHNTYPYKIYFTYKETRTQFVQIVDWSPVLYSKVSTRNATLHVLLPKECIIKKYVRGAKLVMADTINPDFHNFIFSSGYDKINTDQLFAEPFDNNRPRVVIVPKDFIFGINGKTDSWVDYGNWFLNLNKELLFLPSSEKDIVDELLKNVVDPREKVKLLYYYLQDHTRYINVSIGLGGFKAYPASYVAQNKYGDCKALTNYMMALLNYVGIKSYYALINSSFQPEKLLENLPFPQFNHIILAVPFEKDTLWVENTSTSEPIGYLRSSIQNRKALFIDENRSRLISIPTTKTNNISVCRKFRLVLNKNGNGDAQNVFTFGGYNFEQYNLLSTYYNKTEQDQIVKELIPFQSYEVVNWQIQKFARDSAKIRLVTKLNIYKILKPLGSDIYLNLNPVLRYSFERPADRISSLQIPFPINNIDTTIYELPKEFELKKIVDPINIDTQYGKYELITKKEGASIYAIKRLLIYPASYNLEQYKGFYEFIKAVKDAEKKVIIFTGTLLN